MLCLFKSHYSIGKSILNFSEGSNRSIISICKELKLKNIFLVEDSLIGFLEAWNSLKDNKIDLHFGLRVNFLEEDVSEDTKVFHKIILFAKSPEGYRLLTKIYSDCHTKNKGVLSNKILSSFWDPSHLKLCIPFYDSFLHLNNLSFSSFTPDFSKYKPVFLTEDNGLPFDNLLKEKVDNYCESFSFDTIPAKSIYYKNRSDFDAFLTYKLICSRKNFKGSSSFEMPNIDHMGSQEFCIESYLEKCDT